MEDLAGMCVRGYESCCRLEPVYRHLQRSVTGGMEASWRKRVTRVSTETAWRLLDLI